MRTARRFAAVLLAGVAMSGLPAPAAETPAPELVVDRAPTGMSQGLRPSVSFVIRHDGVRLSSLRLDGVEVTALVRREGAAHRFDPPADLAGGEHVVRVDLALDGGTRSESWTFATPLPPPRPLVSVGYSLQGEADQFHAEPASGPGPTRNTNVGSIAPHFEGSVSQASAGASAEWNATWAQSYDAQNPPVHVSPPAMAIRGRMSSVTAALGNGPAQTFAPSLLLSTVTTRRGLELGVEAPFGAFHVYGSIDDGLPSASGINQFRQNLYGASIAPALGERLKTRFIFQYAEDVSDPLYARPPAQVPPFGDTSGPGIPTPQPVFFGSAPKKGVLGALALEWLVLRKANAVLKADVAISDYSANSPATALAADWAWAISLAASPAGWNISAGIRNVGNGFGSPANPALVAGRRIFDASLGRAFGLLFLSASYGRTLDSGGAGSGGGTWYSPPSGSGNTFSILASLSLPSTRTSFSAAFQWNENESAAQEARQKNLSLNVGQPIGTWQVSFGLLGGIQSISGPISSETRQNGATLGVMKMGTVFSAQGSVGVNRSENVSTGETMTGWNALAMPDVALFRRVLSINPMAAYSSLSSTSGLSDSDSLSWGGRLTLRTWGALKGFAIFAQYLDSRTDPKAPGVPGMHDRRFTAGLALLLGGGSLGPTLTLPQVQAPLR